jgi:hypothetical protein
MHCRPSPTAPRRRPLWCPAEQKRQSPAEEPGFFIRRLRRRYFAPATLPNWLSNGL